ncbi:hypothetical protein LRP49_05620 [Enterovibrio sp. ZSDZ35]|uniref:Uncharacterized protein n=1 Tax=Enterovibrio qingdaonensis TaxID=2899818 RepID=A0ABT5QJ22_9GAMM|nr:hypothetical protein [Enterovibrio sp. ZSDZ35]MDD1780678.1 hypothetical protein [Enterovibrio sp. ZSDZ35]
MHVDLSNIDKDRLFEFVTWAKNQKNIEMMKLELHGRNLKARVLPEVYEKITGDTLSEKLFSQDLRLNIGNQMITTDWRNVDQENVVNLLINDLRINISRVH